MTRSSGIDGSRLALGVCLLLSTAVAVPASAQEDDASRAASARAMFEEGVAFADKDQWRDAADRFRRALALRPSPVIVYNLASALQELGELIEASELLRRIPSDEQADAALRASAQSALAELTPRIARITVHAEGKQAGDRITIDEKELLDAQLDVAVPIDPHAHVLRATRGQETLATQDVVLVDGQALELTLQLARAPAPREVAAAAAPAPVDRTPTESSPLTGKVWFWASIGAVAVAGAVVATLLLTSSNDDAMREPAAGDFDPPVVGVKVMP